MNSLQRTLLPAFLALGTASVEGLKTGDHFKELGDVVRESYRNSDASRPVAALGALRDGLSYDAMITLFRALNKGVKFYDSVMPAGNGTYQPRAEPVAVMAEIIPDHYR